MNDTAHVKGLSELQRVLDTLPAAIERNIMRGALRAGAKVFERSAKARAPVAPPTDVNRRLYGGRRGLLRDSVRVSVRARAGRLLARVIAGGKAKGGGIAYYAGWVEKGTKPHTITAKRAKALVVGGSSGRAWSAHSVQHPGARPNPFMTPAFDESHQQALVAVREYIRNRLATKQGAFVPGPESEE